VKVTVAVPPQALGMPGLLLVKVVPQPPIAVTEANQFVYLVSMAACVWQAASVISAGQVSTTELAFTVKVRVQVTGASQLLATVKVTVAVPPQASGAPALLLVKTALQPPLVVAVANQAAYLVLICAWVWQAISVVFTGHVKTTAEAAVTVKVRVQVSTIPQVDITVKVTVATPPQALGAPELLLVKTALQPPVTVAVASQAAYFVLIWACVWQAASVTFAAQVKLTAGAAVTVNVRVQVTGAWLLLLTVKVTVAVPPQAIGGPVLLLVKTALQPPVKVAIASQALYLVLMAACV
jgi:hypothetical protein